MGFSESSSIMMALDTQGAIMFYPGSQKTRRFLFTAQRLFAKSYLGSGSPLRKKASKFST
jgi:hypothetical protein